MKNFLHTKISVGLLASTMSVAAALPALAQTAANTPAVKPPTVVEPGLPAVTFDSTSFQQNQQLLDSLSKSYDRLGKIVEALDKTKASVDQQKAVIIGQAPIQKNTNAKTGELVDVIENLTALIEEQRKQTEESKKLLEKQLASVSGKPDAVGVLSNTDGGTTLYSMAQDDGQSLPADAQSYLTAYDDGVLNVGTTIDFKTNPSASAKIMGDRMATAAITASLAETAYKRAGESMARLPAYAQDLAESESLKQSIDLNTRILLELLQQSNEELRVSAARSFSQSHEIMSEGALVANQK